MIVNGFLRLRRAAARRLGIGESASLAHWLRGVFVRTPEERARLPQPPLVASLQRLHQRFSHALHAIDLDRHFTALAADGRPAAGVQRGVAVLASLALGWLVITTPLPAWAQVLFFLGTLGLVLLLRKIPGHASLLAMIAISSAVSLRYIWWRITQTMDLEHASDYLIGGPLLLAEAYTWVALFLGYLQTAWPLQRRELSLPSDRSTWPSVDVFIPTYSEPLDVVRPGVLAALALDWPADKLRVFLLDDGRRAEFRDFAAQVGVHYLVRSDNRHAKAGNLNNALAHSDGEFVAVFDCDHIATRDFLTATLGWLVREPGCAVVQTPHNFFSPDPFEKNLQAFRRVPNEGELFYGVVQDGNDLWNATFFCGSCAVLRRAPLLEIGGFATDTVTEDVHTAMRLHDRGYGSAYLNRILASGLATENLPRHIAQRVRWARGMVQLFRLDNPLRRRGLGWAQRLCYSNAILNFFNGLPRLIFLIAPLAYLYFDRYIINASALVILLYALPHMVHAHFANTRIRGRFRHSFWASLYESVIAWYLIMPTIRVLLRPHSGKFNVTAKGGLIERGYFDWAMAAPNAVLIALNLGGLLNGIGRLLGGNPQDTGALLMNVSWAFLNLLTLGATLAVAAEMRQVRRSHRISATLDATVCLPDGSTISARTTDVSLTGAGLRCAAPAELVPGMPVSVQLAAGARTVNLPARVATRTDLAIGLDFDELTLAREAALVQCTFANPAVWEGWREVHGRDEIFGSAAGMLRMAARGYGSALRDLLNRLRMPRHATVPR
ncbi:MAG: UDP-forming cellulose synthase catalytic subunit [Gammaproteobacteria bacterium]|nr:UDP-forming cellulose synthase catalytic subunit [Gammaproteobacteria bacterium]